MKPRILLLLSAALASVLPLEAQTAFVDWGHQWSYLHPDTGALPAGSGATTPHPAGTTPWYAAETDFGNYTGTAFTGPAAGPLGYGPIDYITATAEFTALGTTLSTPASGSRYTGYFRTTFTVPNDGDTYSAPVIRYLMDDGGYIYLDGEPVLRVNVAAPAAGQPDNGNDDFLQLALGTASTESPIRDADLTLAVGATTGGNAVGAIAGNATLLKQVATLAPGTHTLAVSLHNAANNSSDLAMALQFRMSSAASITALPDFSATARNFNGTPADPSDDTFAFDVTVNGQFASAQWTLAAPPPGFPGSGPYNVPVTSGDQSANSALIFDFADEDTPALTTQLIVNPPYIIGGINLTGAATDEPLLSLASTGNNSWVSDSAALTLSMNDGDAISGGLKTVTSHVVNLAAVAGAVNFTMTLDAVATTTSGFEPTEDFFFAELLLNDGVAVNPVSLIDPVQDADGSGMFNGTELVVGQSSNTYNFNAVIPDNVQSAQLVIRGICTSGSETMTVRSVRFSIGAADSDGDGMSDAYENANGLDPGTNDAALDLDGDGQSNLAEFNAGTAANDPSSNFRITDAFTGPAAGQFTVTWNSVPGKKYGLEASPDPGVTSSWAALPGSVTATGASTTVSDVLPPGLGDKYFLRVKIVP